MTIRERLAGRLVENGLWPDEVAKIMPLVEASEANRAMEGRWEDTAEGYPEVLFAALWHSTRRCAVEWLNKNEPKHFAILMLQE